MIISLFNGTAHTKQPKQIKVEDWLNDIKNGKYKKDIEKLRKNYGTPKYDELKKILPAGTLSVLCKHRARIPKGQEDDRFISYSHIIQIDIDKTDNVEETKKILSSDPHCLFAFVSPSGKGVKCGFLVDKDEKTHFLNFLAVERHILEKHKIQIDPQVKDLYRLCFVSYDPDLYYNKNATPLIADVKAIEEEIQAEQIKKIVARADTQIYRTKKLSKQEERWQNGIRKNVLQWARDTLSIPKGARHWARLDAGRYLGGWIESGLFSDSEVYAEILPYVRQYSDTPDKAVREFEAAIEYGKGDPIPIPALPEEKRYKAIEKQYKATNKIAKKEVLPQATKETVKSETKTKFEKIEVEVINDDDDTYRLHFTDKETGETKVCEWAEFGHNKRTKKPECEINQVFFGRWLTKQGFYLIPAPLSSKGVVEYELVRIESYVISSVSVDEILFVVAKHFEQAFNNPDFAPFITAFLRTVEQATKQSMLKMSLEKFQGEIISDTKTSAFFCYKNGIVEVSKNVQKLHPYEKIGFYVWKENFINRDFDENAGSSESGGDFEKFVRNLATKRNAKTQQEDFASDRHKALVCSIGHYLHTYKSPISKAVVFTETSLSDRADGRTGKSLLMKAVGKIRNVATIDLRSTSKMDAFHFENVEAGKTEVIFCDEAPRSFKIDDYFSNITDQITINCKFQSKVFLTDKNVPKFAFATNYAVTQTTGSARGRLFDMEIEQYYTAEFQPIDDFGKLFFDDWDKKEWAEFDMFMMSCVRTYFDEEQKLPSYFSNTAAYKKMLTMSNADFIEFMEEEMPKTGSLEVARSAIYKKYCTQYDINEKTLTANRFGRWIKEYCELFNIVFEKSSKSYNGIATKVYIFTASAEQTEGENN